MRGGERGEGGRERRKEARKGRREGEAGPRGQVSSCLLLGLSPTYQTGSPQETLSSHVTEKMLIQRPLIKGVDNSEPRVSSRGSCYFSSLGEGETGRGLQ